MRKIIQINPKDNVCVALCDIAMGTKLSNGIVTVDDIKLGHKIALDDIKMDDPVIKYGYPIGHAKTDIKKGFWVHTHNLKTGLDDVVNYQYQPNFSEIKPETIRTFKGYRRSNMKVGIRNELWIIPTVGCVNNVADKMAELTKPYLKGSIDDVIAYTHPYGCSQMGDDQENTKMILSDLIKHPNAGGVLIVGLGCENSNIDELKKVMGDYDQKRIKFINCQDHEDELADGVEIIKGLIEIMALDQREEIPVSELIIGLKCGGSDGLSGITANPCVGLLSDKIIAQNGTTILTEVPEMFGAETILMNRCASVDIFNKTVELINDFKLYFKSHDQTIYENPSFGNKVGGISTLEDKSLGCTQKAGSAKIVDVLKYGENVHIKGLNLLNSPGNDLVASTALAASGAHIVLFTTGRGTPFACPVPTLKIATNTVLANKKKNWIDFDAGKILEDGNMRLASEKLFELVVNVASGRLVKAEEAGFHDMAIFKKGVTL